MCGFIAVESCAVGVTLLSVCDLVRETGISFGDRIVKEYIWQRSYYGCQDFQ